MKPIFPYFKLSSAPTPCDTLFICESCGKCEWGYDNSLCNCNKCRGRKGGYKRMVRATEEVTKAAREHLLEIEKRYEHGKVSGV